MLRLASNFSSIQLLSTQELFLINSTLMWQQLFRQSNLFSIYAETQTMANNLSLWNDILPKN